MIAGQETAAGKALAIAASLINTYQGITKALAQGGAAGIIQAVAVGAAGFAAVADIVATPIPGGTDNSTTTSAPTRPALQQLTPISVAEAAQTQSDEQQTVDLIARTTAIKV